MLFNTPSHPKGEVNRDGVVNIQDLVLAARRLGQRGQNDADINGDGVVNIQDLVLVAGAFGNTGAAPAFHSPTLTTLTAADVPGVAHRSGADGTDNACPSTRYRCARTTPLCLDPERDGTPPQLPKPV